MVSPQEQLDLLEPPDAAGRVLRAKVVTARVAPTRQAELGQFMTPPGVASFMAGLFPASPLPVCRLLDAGAGMGALSCAFLDRWIAGGFGFERVEATAYEVDGGLRERLEGNLAGTGGSRPTSSPGTLSR